MSLINNKLGFQLPDWLVKEENLPSNHVSIDHIRDLVAIQADKQILLTPNVDETVTNPSHFNKMKVKPAKDMYSSETAGSIRFLVMQGTLPQSHLTTAWFCDFLRRWFELMSSYNIKNALSRINMSAYNDAINFFERSIRIFREMKIGNGHFKPVQTGCMISTKSVMELSKTLLDSGFQFVLTARFLQDCVENIFSSVRFKQPTPTCLEFQNNLRAICASQFLNTKRTGNYFQDDNTFTT